MATITQGFAVAFIMSGGISLCISGFRKKVMPLSSSKRITGRPAKVIGIVSLLLSLAAAATWLVLTGSAG